MLLAIDTNVLARFYIEEPAPDATTIRQAEDAARLLESGRALLVPLSVVLELEWVARGVYGLPRTAFVAIVEHLLGVPHLRVERAHDVAAALDLHGQGWNFADALHWRAAADCAALVSFDTRLARIARRHQASPDVQTPRNALAAPA